MKGHAKNVQRLRKKRVRLQVLTSTEEKPTVCPTLSANLCFLRTKMLLEFCSAELGLISLTSPPKETQLVVSMNEVNGKSRVKKR